MRSGGGEHGALRLTLAVGPYDHVAAILRGEVGVDGVELRPLSPPVEQIFTRSLAGPEWDVFELSMAHIVRLTEADAPFVALPIFTSRMFRHGAIYVRAGSGIETAADLRGARIGVPEWVQTAGVYARGLLAEEGLDLDSVEWVRAPARPGGGPPGAEGPTPLREDGSGETLGELLAAGRLDAVISARPPRGAPGAPSPVRLYADPVPADRAYLERTGAFPVMHAIAIRRSLVERHPWLVDGLLTAFEEAKRRSFDRLAETALSWYPVPWLTDHLARVQALMGSDPWPYGIGANRAAIATLIRYCREQGIVQNEPEPEHLFAPRTVAE